jgi:hypothetical protein
MNRPGGDGDDHDRRAAPDRRRLGFVLMAWGGAGLVILALALNAITGSLSDEDGPFGIDGQRRQLVRLLDASADAITEAQIAADNADDSLVAAGGAAATTAGFMQELSGTMSELAASLRISILGSQPFAAPAEDFDRVAASAARVAADLDIAATGIRLGGEDMAALADELGSMEAETSRLRDSLAAPLDTSAWRVVAAVVLAWLGVPALVSLLLGFRWWRRPAPAPARDRDGRVRRARSPVAPGD